MFPSTNLFSINLKLRGNEKLNDKASHAGSVEQERINSIVKLTLSRPKFHNSLTTKMYEQLEELLDKLKDDDSISVLIIRGAGEKAFAAGTDINHFKDFTGNDGIEYERTIDRIIKKIEGFPKPTIAAINGYAIGGGLIIVTACDLRYTTNKSEFGIPIAKTLGNCLSLDNYIRVSKEFGVMTTKEMLYTGRLLSAEEARNKGVITDIFEEKNLFEKTLEIAKKIESNATSTVEATKIAFNKINQREERKSTIEFEEVIYNVYASEDFHEGVSAYVSKRKPNWK